MSNTRGYFIVFEGCDGCGKTTQTELLRKAISEATGHPCLYEREPNERNAAGAIIRSGLYGGVKFLTESMAYLHVADRLEHIEFMRPLVEKGTNIVCDRYYLSNMAYNTTSRISMADIYAMNKPCVESMKPDLFVFLDVSPEVSKKRRNDNRADKEIYDGDDKQARVRANYLAAIDLLVSKGEKVIVVDASQDIDEVAEEVKKKAFEALGLV
jgi:dTMP kinase